MPARLNLYTDAGSGQICPNFLFGQGGEVKQEIKLSHGKIYQPQVCGSYLIGKELRDSERTQGTTDSLIEKLRTAGLLPRGPRRMKILQTGLSGQLRVDISWGVAMECVLFYEFTSSIETTVTNTDVTLQHKRCCISSSQAIIAVLRWVPLTTPQLQLLHTWI